MKPIQRNEHCAESGCTYQAVTYWFGEGRLNEQHVCNLHWRLKYEREVRLAMIKKDAS